MTISTMAAQLGWRCVQDRYADSAVRGAYTSDLLSDVMANASDAALLITIQSHKNAVAVATLVGVDALVICNERPVPEDMVEAARAEEIGIFVTDADQFTVSGEVFARLERA